VAADSAEALAGLREQAGKFDREAAPGTGIALNRLVAEYGLRSFQTLHDWARWPKNASVRPSRSPQPWSLAAAYRGDRMRIQNGRSTQVTKSAGQVCSSAGSRPPRRPAERGR